MAITKGRPSAKHCNRCTNIGNLLGRFRSPRPLEIAASASAPRPAIPILATSIPTTADTAALSATNDSIKTRLTSTARYASLFIGDDLPYVALMDFHNHQHLPLSRRPPFFLTIANYHYHYNYLMSISSPPPGKLDLIATATFGLEAVVARELEALGYEPKIIQPGRMLFQGDESAICRANLWLRAADRVLVRMGTFEARDFGQLFDRTYALPWEEWIPARRRISRQRPLDQVAAFQRAGLPEDRQEGGRREAQGGLRRRVVRRDRAEVLDRGRPAGGPGHADARHHRRRGCTSAATGGWSARRR